MRPSEVVNDQRKKEGNHYTRASLSKPSEVVNDQLTKAKRNEITTREPPGGGHQT